MKRLIKIVLLFIIMIISFTTIVKANAQEKLTEIIKNGIVINGDTYTISNEYILDAQSIFLKYDISEEELNNFVEKIKGAAILLEQNNVTGMNSLSSELKQKYMQILKEAFAVINMTIEYNSENKTVSIYDSEENLVKTINISEKGSILVKKEEIKEISKCTISNIADHIYTGSEIKPSVVIKDGDKQLSNDDYTVEFTNNVNVGEGKATITGKGKYKGTQTKTFKVVARKISTLTIDKISNKTYTGKAIKPGVTVKYGSKKLKNGTDYSVSYKNNKNVGKATVTITGKGNYTGKVEKTFKIEAKSVKKLKVEKIKDKEYTGKAIKPKVVVKYGDIKLKKDRDYKVSYSNNKKIGKATVTIKGKGNYTGTVKKTFKIKLPKVKNVKAESKDSSSINISWDKNTIFDSYAVYMAKGKDDDYKKVATIKNNKIASYRQSGLLAGTTYYIKIKGYKTIDKKESTSYSKVTKETTQLIAPRISKVKAGKDYKQITWNKTSGAKGYEVYMATSVNGEYSKVATISDKNTVTYKKSDLKSGKKYYFKVRAYGTVDDEKIYSPFSNRVI